MKQLLLTCLLFAATTQLSAQCMMYPVALSERIPQSSLVLEGKIVDQISFWDAAHGRIYTSNLVDVYKTFKNTGSSYIEVITEGGIVGNSKHVVTPSLELKVGDVGVFTLIPNQQPAQFGKPVFEAYASAQGFIRYDLTENKAFEPFKTYETISTHLYPAIEQLTGVNYTVVKQVNPFQQTTSVNTTQGVAAITNFAPTTISAGTNSVLTINGSGFGNVLNASLLEFKNASTGGTSSPVNPLASQILSWSDTQIQVRVPSGAGTGVIKVNGMNSTGVLTIPYAHINVESGGNAFTTKHVNEQGGGYMWTYNTTFMANTAAKAAFERSLNSWRCNTLINWTLASSGSSIATATSDGVNIVTFDGTLPLGVLGRCTNYFSGCGSGASSNWVVGELDIVFDPTPGTLSWQYGPTNASGSQYDFESVAVHELGHGHELGHVINTSDLMHYNIGAGQVKRTINADDLAGGQALMTRNAQSGSACGNPLMVPLTASACSLGALNAGIVAASGCPNQAITLTDASSGSPTSWTWSMPGGTPASATTQNASVTYATAGSKVVSLTVTSGTATSTVSQTITVNTPPTVIITASATTICTGQSTILKASGAITYTWTPGPATTANYTVSPAANTVYTVSGTLGGCVSAPTTVAITLSACTGLDEKNALNSIWVYPNPSNGVFTISGIENTGKLEVSVLNMLGQTVKSESSTDAHSLNFDMSSYSKGVYYVKVQLNDDTKLIKVVLQ